MRWLNSLSFSGREQKMLLDRISALVQTTMPIRNIFELLHKHPGNSAEQQIARLSLDSISDGQHFARHYHSEGWFPVRVAALLVAAEEHNCLPSCLKVIRNSYSDKDRPWLSMLRGNTRWLITVLICSGICVFLSRQRELFEQVIDEENFWAQQLVFGLGEALQKWGLVAIVVAIVLIMVIYWQLRYNCSNYRDKIDRWPLFRDYRQTCARKLIAEMTAFLQTGLGARAALDVMMEIHARGYRHHCLRQLRFGLQGGLEFTDAVSRALLNSRYRSLLGTLIISSPGKADEALLELTGVMTGEAQLHYQKIGYRITGACLIVIFLLTYGILQIIYSTPNIL